MQLIKQYILLTGYMKASSHTKAKKAQKTYIKNIKIKESIIAGHANLLTNANYLAQRWEYTAALLRIETSGRSRKNYCIAGSHQVDGKQLYLPSVSKWDWSKPLYTRRVMYGHFRKTGHQMSICFRNWKNKFLNELIAVVSHGSMTSCRQSTVVSEMN